MVCRQNRPVTSALRNENIRGPLRIDRRRRRRDDRKFPQRRTPMSQALAGLRVIDMTHNQAGPACAQMLGFLGADVIKLEEPKGGDIARRNMRDREDSDSLFFLLFNANKQSLTLNLKTEEGKALFKKVISQSDV